jgi:hydrogenase nickel incorporation protein HypA/HybF
MHELSVCQAMMEQVRDIALQRQADVVTSVKVQVGPLSGVEPQLLKQAFPIASAGSVAQGATLVLEASPVRVRCERCNEVTEAKVNRLLCGNCGDYRTRLVSGDELLLTSVEMQTERDRQTETGTGEKAHV